jgi:ribosomal protein S12 methylthiotransferase
MGSASGRVATLAGMARRFWVETLGCPKNEVDSDKLAGVMLADGLIGADRPETADLVVVNTCGFIEEARQESIDVVLGLADRKADGARLVVTGCMAERYGSTLADALPEADAVVGFGVPVHLGPSRASGRSGSTVQPSGDVPAMDLLNLGQRITPSSPWAYVKAAEGCDRACGFCAIPSFRGPQRSRPAASIFAEVEGLASRGVREVVLVAQDLAAYGRDRTPVPQDSAAGPSHVAGDLLADGDGIVPLTRAVAERVDRVRLLYLYPSSLTDDLVDAIRATGVAYFDLSLQHVSRPLLRRMRRWGDGERFLERIESIRARTPEAAFRSNFIVGYPGETERDHDRLLAFIDAAQLDWVGFFAFSREPGTYADGLDGHVPAELVNERLLELRELQDRITAARRDALVGTVVEALVDEPGVARSHREAPEIDGVIGVPPDVPVGALVKVRITGAAGPDLDAELV